MLPAIVGQCSFFPLGVPGVSVVQMQGMPAPSVHSSDQGKVPKPRQFERGESSKASRSVVHAEQKWDVDHFFEEGRQFVHRGYPEEAIT